MPQSPDPAAKVAKRRHGASATSARPRSGEAPPVEPSKELTRGGGSDVPAGQCSRDRDSRPPPDMPEGRARAIAERAHRGQVEPSGRPYIDHVRRVAAAVPVEAVSVAWLHDVLEWTDVGEEDLVAAGLAPQEVAAVRLLTRLDESDDGSFLSHVRVIALTPGPAGDLARAVKRADMEDRLRLPRDPAAAWRPPYLRALGILARHRAGQEPGWTGPGGGRSGCGSPTTSSEEGEIMSQVMCAGPPRPPAGHTR